MLKPAEAVLTNEEKERLKKDLDYYDGGHLMEPAIPDNLFKTGYSNKNDKKRYQIHISPLFLNNAPWWKDKIRFI